MDTFDTVTDYDGLASDYDVHRRPAPAVLVALQKLWVDVAKDDSILSIGCGTGNYEAALSESGWNIVGLDRSTEMLRIARTRIDECIQGSMLSVPCDDDSFSAAYYVQSFHHVGATFDITPEQRTAARIAALQEAFRVVRSGPISIVQRDPSQNQAIWFWKYFPQALERKLQIQPEISQIADWFSSIGLESIQSFPLDDPVVRGYYDPRAPLELGFRNSSSEFSYLSESEMREGLESLRRAIEDGSVHDVIEESKSTFKEIGGNLFVISGVK